MGVKAGYCFKKKSDMEKRCLICGEPLTGRSDKKFCSRKCKNAYHNDETSQYRNYRNRILTSLNSNYRILDTLISQDVESISLYDIEALGFKSAIVTGYTKSRMHRNEFRCFNIKYNQSETKIFGIRKIVK